jgi:hypothetical protein
VYRLKVDAEHIKVEEDKLKIIWHAAGIEKWLLGQLWFPFVILTGPLKALERRLMLKM